MATLTSVVKFFPTAKEGFTTTLASSISSGAATVPLNSVTGYTNGDVVVLVVEPTSLTAKQAFTGVVDTAGVQITSVVWTEGTNQTHASGATVVDYATATHISMMTKGLLVSMNEDGTMITSLPLTTPKITTSINDSGGNEVIKTPATASAVNEITVTNAASGNNPRISATGGGTNVSLDLLPKGTGHITTNGSVLLASLFDHVVSGCVWTADAAGSTKVASMTSGVVFIGGSYLTVAAVVSRTFTASKDTYIDVSDSGSGTGTVAYDASAANNAASPALAAGSLRLGIIQTGATFIATAACVNQGQEDRLLPIASSVAYSITDSLGNLICPRDPQRRLLGYKSTTATFSTSSTTAVVLTGLQCPVIVPTGRKVKVTIYAGNISQGSAGRALEISIYDGVPGVGTRLQSGAFVSSGIGYELPPYIEILQTATGSKSYGFGVNNDGSGTITSTNNASYTAWIKVELV